MFSKLFAKATCYHYKNSVNWDGEMVWLLRYFLPSPKTHVPFLELTSGNSISGLRKYSHVDNICHYKGPDSFTY